MKFSDFFINTFRVVFGNKMVDSSEMAKMFFALGKKKGDIEDLIRSKKIRGYYPSKDETYGFVKSKIQKDDKILFEFEVHPTYFKNPYNENKNEPEAIYAKTKIIKSEIPYEQALNNPCLRKYVKLKSLEKHLAVFSIASVLASTFFLANNITGNAILTNNANSSGIIGAGLFVLGLVSFILARNI